MSPYLAIQLIEFMEKGVPLDPEVDIKRYMNLLTKNFWNLDNFISRRYQLEQINEAINDMKKGISAGRIVIDMKF